MKTLATLLCLLLLAPQLWGYAEDSRTGGAHSTFHYNLVRTLAAAAGFSSSEAETIATLSEATDVGTWNGVTLTGTTRPNANEGQQSIGLYYHFGRRGDRNATGEYAWPGDGGTCRYFDPAYIAGNPPPANCPMSSQAQTSGFAGEPGPCQVLDDGQIETEVGEIELWAVYGRGLPRFGPPTLARGTSAPTPVSSRTLESLGIYLHALADSYSHEACIRQCNFQGHSNEPGACNAAYWHESAEYGPGDDTRSAGTEYTREAANAVWLALRAYRRANNLPGSPRWTDQATSDFINQWVDLNEASDRETLADDAFSKLTT